MGNLSVGVVQIPAAQLEAFGPGVGFSLKGPFRQVLSVSYVDSNYHILAVRDEELTTFHEKELGLWRKLKKSVEAQGKPFDKPEPKLEGPTLTYLEIGADPIEALGPYGTFVGQAGNYVFFANNPPSSPLLGLFGM